jgi:hypothetical protein
MTEKPERRSPGIFLLKKDVGASPLSPSRYFYPDVARRATEIPGLRPSGACPDSNPATEAALRQTSNDNALAREAMPYGRVKSRKKNIFVKNIESQ